jgi:hypothetical protein
MNRGLKVRKVFQNVEVGAVTFGEKLGEHMLEVPHRLVVVHAKKEMYFSHRVFRRRAARGMEVQFTPCGVTPSASSGGGVCGSSILMVYRVW